MIRHRLSLPAAIIATIITTCLVTPDAAHAIVNGTWTHYTRQAPISDILSIHTFADGTLWASTDSTLNEFDGEFWHKYPIDTYRFVNCTPFFADSDGSFYYFVSKSVVVFNPKTGELTEYAINMNLTPVCNAAEGPDGIYIASKNNNNGGIYYIHDGLFEKVREGKTNSVVFDHDDRLWAVHQDSTDASWGLYIRENGIWTDASDSVSTITYATVVATAPDGAVWINNLGRHTVYHDGIWDYYTGGDYHPLYIAFGSDGSVWGHSTNQLFRRNDEGVWELSDEFDSTDTHNTPLFFASADGYPCCVYDGHSVYRYDESVLTLINPYPWSLLPNPYDLGSDTVTCMTYNLDGQLLCGHGDPFDTDYENWEDAGLSIFDGERWYNITEATGEDLVHYQFDNVFALKILDNGNVMISSDSGYATFYDGMEFGFVDSLECYDGKDGKRTGTDFCEDDNYDLWVATTYGLIEHDYIDEATVHYPPEDTAGEEFNRIFIDKNTVYLQEVLNDMIVSYDMYEDEWTVYRKLCNSNIRDFVVYNHSTGDPWVLAAMFDGLYWSDDDFDVVQATIAEDSDEVIVLPYASLLEIDYENNIWASGYNNTGYIDGDGTWNRIEALQNMQASEFACTYDYNHYAVNSISIAIDMMNQEEVTTYDGLYVFSDGSGSGIADDTPVTIPLSANYPNPFNASTTISFNLPASAQTVIGIYNITGQLVRTLVDDRLAAGSNTVVWDSRDDHGEPVASGLYLYRILAGPTVMTGKMLLLK